MNRIALFLVAAGLSLAPSAYPDDNVREVQTKLSEQGIYFGQIDGAYSSDLSAALSRYQIRNGLPITGQLDVETSKSLGAKPAVGPSTAAADQSSETWRQLRKGERRASTHSRKNSSSAENETEGTRTETRPEAASEPAARSASETAEATSAPPATTPETAAAAPEFTPERLGDYVAAFILAGLDKNVGAETEFFADRVAYYDSGTMDRENIRADLKRYDEKWPERHFWLAGKISIEPQSDGRLRVTFPLGFKLRNGNKQASGKVEKTLLLEPA